jgi:hypothetical protein
VFSRLQPFTLSLDRGFELSLDLGFETTGRSGVECLTDRAFALARVEASLLARVVFCRLRDGAVTNSAGAAPANRSRLPTDPELWPKISASSAVLISGQCLTRPESI